MKPAFKNILAILVGLVIGSLVNMSLINLGMVIIPPPEGTDTSSMEGLIAAMPNFTAINFLFPFLAHAFGTFVGAIIAGLIAAKHKARIALCIGLFFQVAGIINVFMLPAPTWFCILDVLFAYIPMGWMAGRLVESKFSK